MTLGFERLECLDRLVFLNFRKAQETLRKFLVLFTLRKFLNFRKVLVGKRKEVIVNR